MEKAETCSKTNSLHYNLGEIKTYKEEWTRQDAFEKLLIEVSAKAGKKITRSSLADAVGINRETIKDMFSSTRDTHTSTYIEFQNKLKKEFDIIVDIEYLQGKQLEFSTNDTAENDESIISKEADQILEKQIDEDSSNYIFLFYNQLMDYLFHNNIYPRIYGNFQTAEKTNLIEENGKIYLQHIEKIVCPDNDESNIKCVEIQNDNELKASNVSEEFIRPYYQISFSLYKYLISELNEFTKHLFSEDHLKATCRKLKNIGCNEELKVINANLPIPEDKFNQIQLMEKSGLPLNEISDKINTPFSINEYLNSDWYDYLIQQNKLNH